MTMTCSFTAATDLTFRAQLRDVPLPDVYICRPAIKIPRSARREYTDSELSTAAAMLAEMRLRRDAIVDPKTHGGPAASDSDHALDVVIEKLLDLM